MELKITGYNKENFEENLTHFLNVATMICLKGHIPTQDDIINTRTHGMWWFKETDNKRFQLLGSNNNWLNIVSEGENFIVVEFNFRYDKYSHRKNTISRLMLEWFDFVDVVEK